MKKGLVIFCVLGAISLFYTNCSPTGFYVMSESSFSGSSTSLATGQLALPIKGNEANVMTVTLGCGYVNQPCVNVTICLPGTSTCQVIPNLLLDTGSSGLRIFKSAVTLNLTQALDASGRSLAQCISYMDGTSQWGPVKKADVMLGQLRASQVPIQIIDSTFPKASAIPSDCTDLDTASSGYNGILGLGIFKEDCGGGCQTSSNNRIYFGCTASTCTGTAVNTNDQVANPVNYLSTNNNGVILQLPVVGDTGVVSAVGYLVLGIGDQANDTPPAGVTYLPADTNGNFKTSFNGSTSSGFIDSGSNGIFFPGPASLTECSDASGYTGFYCPSVQNTFSATQMGASGGAQKVVPFNVGNASMLMANSSLKVFNNVAGKTDVFDWGLPFFLGRTVYIGLEDKTSILGTGPYWAF